MTTWDNIYRNFQKGGEAWATLSEEILPEFRELVEKANFKTSEFPQKPRGAQKPKKVFDIKKVLDIGCGTGKYLKYLQEKGFKVAGIDSSENAVKMSKELLGKNADIKLADMYDFVVDDKYDLVVSVATIHHGLKEDIRKLIAQTGFIPRSLLRLDKTGLSLKNTPQLAVVGIFY